MHRFLFALSLLAPSLATVARADEADDLLARQLANTVRDPRLTERQRAEAAKMLGKLGIKAGAAVPQLLSQLERLRGTEFSRLQEEVLDALSQIGPAARPGLPVLARVADRSIDLDVAVKKTTTAILNVGDDLDVAGLVDQLNSADSSLRVRAAKALGGYRANATSAVPALTVALTDLDGDVRRAAIASLRLIAPGARPSKELIQAYILDLKDPDDAIRLQAVRALGRFGPDAAAAAPVLEGLLVDPEKDVRRAAADALPRISPP